jgi:putative oxidoreductase
MVWVDELNSVLRQWDWIGALLARLSVGLLFFLSGRARLFIPTRREQMRDTLRTAGVPAPDVTALFVSATEFVFGGLLAIGLLTPLSCVMLSGVMVVALLTTIVPGIKSSSVLDWLGEFLYLPETLYVVILLWLLLAGPGWVSLDHLLASRV